MTHANLVKIGEGGRDFADFGNLRYHFKDDENGTKENAASFFRNLKGKLAAIEAPESMSDGARRFYIAVDLMPGSDENSLRVLPMPFTVSSVSMEISL
jgi:hypothetical protein